MLKYIVFIIGVILVLGSKPIVAQSKSNYVLYYALIHKAESFDKRKEFVTALESFDSAFKSVPYQYLFHLLEASQVAMQLKKNDKATEWLRLALLAGLSPEQLSQKSIKTLAEQTKFRLLKDSAVFYHQQFKKRLNHAYIKEIDSLYYVDQVIIRHRKTATPLYKNMPYVYANERVKYDSLSFLYLIKLIEAYGFPSEQKIGAEAYERAKLIIHHSLRMPFNRRYLPLFEKAVLTGDYQPQDYAWAFDQLQLNEMKLPFYFQQCGDISKLKDEEKKEINARRKKIGLPPL
jgi:hypothetical protein